MDWMKYALISSKPRLSTKLILFGLLLVMTTSLTAQKDQRATLEQKRQDILSEIKQINTLLFKTQKQEKSVLTQVQDLDQRISAQENLIRITNQQANLLTKEVNNNIRKIDGLRQELATLKEDYAQMVIKSYKSKSQKSRLMFLLSSHDFLQAYKRIEYMNQYAKFRKEQGLSIQAKTIELQTLNTDLVEQKKQKKLLVQENQKSKLALSKEKTQQQELIATLKKDESKFASQIKVKQREADAIDKQIDALIRAAIASSNTKAGKSSTSSKTFALTAEAKALGVSFTGNKGKLPWPVESGVVTKRFGKQRHPQLANVTTFNSGVYIVTSENTKARAVFNGTVLEIQQLKGANKAIMIQHGSYISVYTNLSNVQVRKGDIVTTKQELGTIAKNFSTGKTTLKFSIFKNTTRLNPADWVFKM